MPAVAEALPIFAQSSIRLPSVVAAETISDILTSPGFDKIWRRHYASRSECPALLAAEYKAHAENLAARPDLVSFGHRVVSIERAALGKDSGLAALQAYFSGLKSESAIGKSLVEKARDFAIAAMTAVQLKDPEILKQALRTSPKETHEEEFRRETMEKMLLALEKETAQTPFAPVKSSWKFLKKWAAHFVEEIGEHKVSNGILFGFSIAAYKFMMMRLPPSTTIRVTPEETTITNLNLDTMSDATPLTHDPAIMQTHIPVSCHDHLKMLTGSQAFADFARDKLTIGGTHLFPQDCSKMNNFAGDAQARMLQGYNFMNDRLRWFIEDRVTDVANVLPDSPFITAFNASAHNMAQYVYIFDNIENLTFHGGLFISSLVLAHRLNTLNNVEAREKWNSIKDFFERTARNNYLTYGLGAAAAGAYALSGAPQTGVMSFWAGLAGCGAGQLAHRFMNAANRKEHARQLLEPVRARLEEFKEFAEVPLQNAIQKPARKKAGLLATFSMATALGMASMVSITHSAKAGEIAGTAAGRSAVVGTFVFLNAPQDSLLHVIFALAGGLSGCVTGNAAKLAEKGLGRLRRREPEV